MPSTCANCQACLPTEPGPDDPEPRWHQTAELPPFPVVVTEYQAHARICGCCGQVTWAQIPAEIAAHCFGPNLTATVSFLSGYCHDSKRNVEQIVVSLASGATSAKARSTARPYRSGWNRCARTCSRR